MEKGRWMKFNFSFDVDCCEHHYEHPHLRLGVGPMKLKENKMALREVDVTMSSEHMVLLHAVPVTAAGNPDEVQDPPVFTVVSGDCTFGNRESPTSMWLLAGTPGDCEVEVSGDADLGVGVVPIVAMYHVHVLDPQAAGFDVTADEPVLKPIV